MPDPISSSSSANPALDPYSDEVGKMSRADAPNSSQAPLPIVSTQTETPATSSPAVPKLVSSVPPPSAVLPPSASSPTASSANNSAQRTSETLGIAPYRNSGKTAAGDSVYAGAALIKGHDAKSGADVEVLTASGQVGAQTELQAGLQRISGGRGALAGSVEAFTARANVGIHNDDGSTGLNVGVGATAVGFEGTLTFGGASSFTYGVAASAGAGASVGARDIDRDGRTELCARVSFGPVTVGACVETPL